MNTIVNTLYNTQGKAATTKTEKEAFDEAAAEMFSDVMNQATNLMNNGSGKYDSKTSDMGIEAVPASADKTGFTDKDYAQMNNKSVADKVKESSAAKETKSVEKIEKRDVDSDIEKLDELTDKVTESIKTKLNVSEDDIEEAMEVLGMIEYDLLNPQKLIELAAKLKGEGDTSVLLTDAGFTDMMKEVNSLLSDFMNSEGLSEEELKLVISNALDAMDSEAEPEFDFEITYEKASEEELREATSESVSTTKLDQSFFEDAEDAVFVDDNEEAKEVVSLSSKEVITAKISGSETDEDKTQARFTEVSGKIESSETAAKEMKSSDAQSENNFSDEKEDKDTANTGFSNMINANQEPVNSEFTAEAVTETQQRTFDYEEINNLMNQFDALARSFVENDETTVEMQLNPANLGRMFLSVSERQGVVSAQITTTNAEVRDALLTQLNELKENLGNQGIKVEAVEVTVASHEFEQNLEQNDNTNMNLMQEQQRENSGQGNGSRNINLGDAGEIPDDLTDEEALRVSMMRDNGNSVDFTA